MSKVVSIDSARPHHHRDIECQSCGRAWVAVCPEGTKSLECPGCGLFVNAYGVRVLSDSCDTCGRKFTVAPYPQNPDNWRNCLAMDCESYDPLRDVDRFWDLVERGEPWTP